MSIIEEFKLLFASFVFAKLRENIPNMTKAQLEELEKLTKEFEAEVKKQESANKK